MLSFIKGIYPFSSVTQLCPTLRPCGLQHARPPCPSPTPNLLKLMSIKLVTPSNHLILCHPLLLSVFPSIRVFSSDSVLHIRWPKYWSFSIRPSNEYSGLISFWIDLFDCLPVQGTLKSLLQYHSSKASVSSVLRFLYDPTFTCVHDYWKSHSFDCRDLHWQFLL